MVFSYLRTSGALGSAAFFVFPSASTCVSCIGTSVQPSPGSSQEGIVLLL